MKPVDTLKRYKCRECGESEFEIEETFSDWKQDFLLFQNVAYGACTACGTPGEISTLNKTKFYDYAPTIRFPLL